MKNDLANIKDFDDLVFEFRNKDYGAYKLRKKYNGTLLVALIIAVFIGSSLVIIPFIARKPADMTVYGGGGSRYVSVNMDVLEPPQEEFYIPAAPPPRERGAIKIEESIKYSPPEIVDTIMPFEPIMATIDQALLEPVDTSYMGYMGSGFGDDIFDGEGWGSDYGEPLFIVETMPSFRGGDLNKFRLWVQNKINYPQEAIDKKIQGRVFLTFIIEADGSVSNVTVVKGLHPIIDSVAVKAIRESPRWSPGRQRGQPVRVRYSFPLNFAI